MEPEEAEDVRRLMSYGEETAGGMMTPEPVILGPDATVADALAHVRNPDLTPALAALVYVCRQPLETPTGKLLGVAHIQRLLREPPSTLVAGALDDSHGDACAPRRPSTRSRPTWRRTTWWRRPSSTRTAACSARSPSTTCSTTCCPRTGATEALRHRTAGRRPWLSAARPRGRLDTPRELRRRRWCRRPTYDPDAFGIFAEQFARFMGTATFLIYMTLFVAHLGRLERRWRPRTCAGTTTRSSS